MKVFLIRLVVGVPAVNRAMTGNLQRSLLPLKPAALQAFLLYEAGLLRNKVVSMHPLKRMVWARQKTKKP